MSTQFPFWYPKLPSFSILNSWCLGRFPLPQPQHCYLRVTYNPRDQAGMRLMQLPLKDRQDNPIHALHPCPVTSWSLRILVVLFPQTFTFIKLFSHPNLINPPSPSTLLSGTHGLPSAKISPYTQPSLWAFLHLPALNGNLPNPQNATPL